MREVKFRGKRIDCNVWVLGYFEKTWSVINGKSTSRYWINVNTEFSYDEKYEVHAESIGQDTGLPDIWSKYIFEGDILKDEFDSIGVVKWTIDSKATKGLPYSCPAFVIEWNDGDITGFNDSAHLDYQVVGNIYDNIELLKTQAT